MSGNPANNPRVRAAMNEMRRGVAAFLAQRSANNWRARRQRANAWAAATGRPHWEMPEDIETPPQPQPRPLPRAAPQYESMLLTSMGLPTNTAETNSEDDDDYDNDNNNGEE